MIEYETWGGKILPLFKKFEDLARDEEEIMADYVADWESAYEKFDRAQDIIRTMEARATEPFKPLAKLEPENDSPAALLKAIRAEFAEVHAAHDRIKREIEVNRERVRANATLAASLKAAIAKRNERLFGLGAVAKRSQRFAQAHSRKYYGPAAAVLSIDRSKS